jgi:hypothetical protein
MRYSVLFALIILFNTNLLNGQPLLGFAVGANYPEIPYTDFYDHADVNSQLSYTLKSDFRVSVCQNLYYSIGIAYNHFLAHINGSESTSSHRRIEDIDLTLGFLTLYIMPEYSFGRKDILFIKLGGYFSLLANSKEVGTFTSSVVDGAHHSGEIDNDASHDYRDIDFGLSAVTGIRLKITDNAYFVPQIGYNLGLYKYNLIGSDINDIQRGGFKSAYLLLGIDFELSNQ